MSLSARIDPCGDQTSTDQRNAGSTPDDGNGLITGALGGPFGRYAIGAANWINFSVVAILLATVTWLLTTVRQGPCLDGAEVFLKLCYTDITQVYSGSNLAAGQRPYFGADVEVPVLTGYFIELARQISVVLGAAPPGDPVLFLGVNAALLFLCFLLAVIAAGRVQSRPQDAIMVAVSPVVVMTGLINWDLFAVALTACALWAWSAKRPVVSGVLFGLAIAARIYPGFLLVALLIVCLRGRRMPQWLNLLGAALVAWAVVNVPIMVLSPAAWLASWTGNTQIGSFWYVLDARGTVVPELDTVSTLLFAVAVLIIGAVAMLGRRRPRVAQVAFLIMWALFVTNVDYRPQYGMILAVLMVAARPSWREWSIFSAGQVTYVVAVWLFLGGVLNGVDGDNSFAFQFAIVLRIASEAWVAAMVVRDILAPKNDPVRAGGSDDPGGGSLDGAADAAWIAPLRARLVPANVLWRRFWYGDAAPGTPALAPLAVADTFAKPLRTVLPAWLISRATLIGVALAVMAATGRTFGEIIYRWDTERFFTIASNGYPAIDMTYRAFYPGWPIVLNIGARLGIPLSVWGVVVATIFSLVAALALVRLGGRWAAVGWVFAPTAIFTMMPYSESLFCALAFWAWQRARSDKWWQAAILAGLACTVRVSGLFLLGALVIMVLTWSGIDWRGRLRRGLWLILTVIMLSLYTFYLYAITGSWSAWKEAQEAGWPREFTMPWTSIRNTVEVANPAGRYADQPWIAFIFSMETVSFVIGVVVVGWCLRRRLWAEASYIAIQLLAFSTSYWLQSVNRATLIWFPLWIMVAHLVADPMRTAKGRTVQRVLRVIVPIISIGLMILWAWMYYDGQWAS